MTDRTSPETETVPLPARMRDFIKSGITQFKEHELREIVAVFCRLPGIAPRPELAPTPDLQSAALEIAQDIYSGKISDLEGAERIAALAQGPDTSTDRASK